MRRLIENPSLAETGWILVSAEEQHSMYPATFLIPDRAVRHSLRRGDAAKLLFDIERREDGRVFDRGVDRMWVIVTDRLTDGYIGILDSSPGAAENLVLEHGDKLRFGPEHVCGVDTPPKAFLEARYSDEFGA